MVTFTVAQRNRVTAKKKFPCRFPSYSSWSHEFTTLTTRKLLGLKWFKEFSLKYMYFVDIYLDVLLRDIKISIQAPLSNLTAASCYFTKELGNSQISFGCAEIPVRKNSLMVLLTLAKSKKEKHVIRNITNQRLSIDKVWSHLLLLCEIR